MRHKDVWCLQKVVPDKGDISAGDEGDGGAGSAEVYDGPYGFTGAYIDTTHVLVKMSRRTTYI